MVSWNITNWFDPLEGTEKQRHTVTGRGYSVDDLRFQISRFQVQCWWQLNDTTIPILNVINSRLLHRIIGRTIRDEPMHRESLIRPIPMDWDPSHTMEGASPTYVVKLTCFQSSKVQVHLSHVFNTKNRNRPGNVQQCIHTGWVNRVSWSIQSFWMSFIHGSPYLIISTPRVFITAQTGEESETTVAPSTRKPLISLTAKKGC